MKKLLGLGLVVGIVAAGAWYFNTTNTDNSVACEKASKIAAIVMKERQNGRLMSELIVEARESAGDDKKLMRGIELIIIEAYKRPQFNTELFRDKNIADFANLVMVECMQE